MNHTTDETASIPVDMNLTGMDHADLISLCEKAGVKPVHAETLNAGIFRYGITDIRKIPDLPNRLYDYLESHTEQLKLECIANQQADDGTHKMLLRMPDNREIESVLIPGSGRITQCISTQVGCAVGCQFCLTATAGLTRNLTTAEMVAQVMTARDISEDSIRNLVLMGMGEPLHNYEAVSKFIRIVTDPMGLAFSPRRVTLSTSGVVPAIYRMIEDELPCNLAVSLNATTDETRSQIIPINNKFPIAELMTAIGDYIKAKDRKRVLIEYVLLKGFNDSTSDANRLVDLLDGLDCTVNLLPFNPFPGSQFERPDDAAISAFYSVLAKADIMTVIRQSKGDEISAACGQLKTEIAQRKMRAA